jgi:uncharacterized protein YcbX
MPENEPSILDEFAQFLQAREESQRNASQEDDYEVEVWNEKGQGARLRRSHAKPFLQNLGIDVDLEPEGNSGDTDNGGTKTKPTSNRQSKGTGSNATGTQSVARKYFVKPAK